MIFTTICRVGTLVDLFIISLLYLQGVYKINNLPVTTLPVTNRPRNNKLHV